MSLLLLGQQITRVQEVEHNVIADTNLLFNPMLKELLERNRSYRRFIYADKIPTELIAEWIEMTRCCASARNAQPLRYVIVAEEETGKLIYPLLKWAGYLKDWDGPMPEERPSAYIVVLTDNLIATNASLDEGIALQTLTLAATEAGYGGCIIGAFDKEEVHRILGLEDNLTVCHVLALGRPKEEIRIENIRNNDIKYWRDEKEVHHVPKRSINDLLIKIF